jgi:hypothetical protein
MSRKYTLVSKRKQDLNSKLKELKDEGDSVFKYVESIIKQGSFLATDLERETDNTSFLRKYPVVIKELDSLVNKIVQLNCNIGVGASDDEAEEGAQNDSCVPEQTFTKSPAHNYERLTPENSIHFSAAHSFGLVSEIVQLNCDFGLGASGEAKEVAHNEPCLTEQTLCSKSAIHTYEQLASENSTAFSDAHNVSPSIHDDSFALETAHSTPSRDVLTSCTLQQGKILDMTFLHGNNPYNFWLHYYASRSQDYLNETMLSRHRNKQLCPFEISFPYTGTYVCVFDGNKCFRGKVLKIRFGQQVKLMVLDVDSGRIRKIEQDRVFRLDEDLLEIPAQALNCRLQGDLGDPSLWNDKVTPLFCKVLSESALVVTICGKIEGDPPQFLVEVECHNEQRINSVIELNKWIIDFVFPKLEQMKDNSKEKRILKSLFTYLDPVTRDEEERNGKNLCSESITKVSPPSTHISDSAVSYPATFMLVHSERHSQGQEHTVSVRHVGPTPQHSHKSQPAASLVNMNLPVNSEVTSEFNPHSPQTAYDCSEGNDGMLCVNNSVTRESTLHLPEEKNVSLHQALRLSSVGQNYTAMLAHVEDPSEFYIHAVCEDNTEIDNLKNRMTQYYRTASISFESKEDAQYHIGLFCAAFYDDDDKWYRAKVINWNQDNGSEQVTIKYVDYGNMALVHFSMLQPLRSEFAELPICATRCSLAMIYPTTLAHDKISESWSREAASAFKCLVNMQSVYSVILVESSDDGDCPLPVLLQECQNGGCIINELMVEIGYAVTFSALDSSLSGAQDPKTEEAPVLDVSTHMTRDVTHVWDPMSEDYYSEMNNVYHDDEDSCYVVTGYKPQDESRVCKFYAQEGRCFKGETCQKEHIYLNPDGWTTDREIMFRDSFTRVVLPAVQDDILLQVTHITKVNMFYAVICDEQQSHCDRVQIKRMDAEEEEEEEEEQEEEEQEQEKQQQQQQQDEKEETLITLNDYMNEEHNVKAMKRCVVMPALGQIVVARFSKDGRFYRARVLDYSETQFCVFYVDYGHKEWVNYSDVRAIEPKYLHLPFQAIECVLANVDDISESVEAQKFFASLVYNKTLHARVIAQVHHVPRLEILLWDEDGYDIGARIIQSNYGRSRVYRAHDLGM